jgi:hypothetical protein
LSTAAFAQVTLTVNEPSDNGTFTSPVTASAFASSPNGPSGWDVYLDNVLVVHNTNTSGILDSTFTAAAGTHTVVITAFDNSGAYKSATEAIAVNASPLPATQGTEYSNLQLQAGNPGVWTSCTSQACSGSAAGATCSATPPGTPPGFGNYNNSLSGASMSENINGTYCNILNYRHLGCPTSGCLSVGNVLEDMWFETTATSQMQGSEFDPDLFDGAYEYQLSTQCRLVSGTDPNNPPGYWYLWNMAANTWVSTPYPCTAATIAPGSFHHYQIYGTFNTASPGESQTYETFVFDGKVVFQNIGITYGAMANTGTATVNVQSQIDNGGETNATNTNYYDNYTLWVW